MRKILILVSLFASFVIFAQNNNAPGIILNGSVNNSTIDTCGVDFFDSGGYILHC